MFVISVVIPRSLLFFVLIAMLGCNKSKKLPDNLKDGLITFEIKQSDNTELIDTTRGKTIYYGPECKCTKKISGIVYKDTLFVKVKSDLDLPLYYDSGLEFKRDTIFLYVKPLHKQENSSPMFSDINYTIVLKNRKFNEIVFKKLE